MKLLSLVSLVLLPNILFSQGATCVDMDPICTDVGASFTASTGATSESGNNYGCLSTQPNPSWYYFEIATSGDIDMNLYANSDIDYAIWGPFTNLAAAKANCGGLGSPIDCSYSSTNDEYPSISGAVVGQVYIMLITNYASVVQDVTLVQTGGSGATDCNIVTNPPCFMNYFEANIGACDPATGTYDINGVIEFDDPPISGDLIVRDCNGNQVVVATAPFAVNGSGAGSYNYTLPLLNANGAACSVSAYFSANTACSQVLNYTAAECICNFNYISVNISPCDDATATFDISGYVEFQSQPTTGTMTISDCNGNSQVFTAPFTSPQNFQILDIPSDGTTNCVITATFSDDPGCVITSPSFNYPECIIGLNCPVDAGSFDATVNGSSNNGSVLCVGDVFTVTPSGGYIPPDDIGGGTTSNGTPFVHNPGMWFAIYDCPPTILAPDDFRTDPCFAGFWETTLPNGPWDVENLYTNLFGTTKYFVPITFYDYEVGIFSYFTAGTLCYDMGPAYPITFLPPIEGGIIEDCFAGTATVNIRGSLPSMDGSNFNVVPGSLTPSTASFVNTSTPNDGTIVVSGLVDGDVYSFEIEDGNGCPVTASGTFVGMEDASFTYNFKYCQNETDPVANITGVPGGTFSATPPGGLVFLNNTTGLIDLSASTPGIYTIEYQSPAIDCWGTETFVITINPIPLVNATEDSPICDDGVSTIQLNETGGEATSWSWTSNGSATITNLSDQNPVVSNDAVNGEIFTVTVTNATTGCSNSDQVSVTVNPIEDASFTLTDFCVGAANSANITGTTGGTFAFNPAVTDGATIAPTTGEISNGVGGTTYTVEYTTGGACPDVSTQDVTVNPVEDASFTLTDYCFGAANSANITGTTGGTFAFNPAVTDGATIAPTTGEISNGVGGTTYTVEYTTGGACPDVSTQDVTVNPVEDASFTLTDYCFGAANSANITGTTGGTFAFNPAVTDGATIAPTTGEISNGVAGTTYTVEYTTGGICFDVSTQDVTVNPIEDASFTLTDYCFGAANSANITGTTGGTFAFNPAVTDGATIAPTTGEISNGVGGTTYTVEYTTGGACPDVSTQDVTVNPIEDASFTLTDFCVGAANSANITGTTGGTFAFNPAVTDGATIAPTTGEISNGVGGTTYTVEYTTGGACPDVSTQDVTVNPVEDASFTLTDYCFGAANSANITGTTGGTFAFNPAVTDGATIAPTTGEISNGVAGTTYTVEYTTGGICFDVSTQDVTVNPIEDASFTLTDYCFGAANSANITGTTGGTFAFNPAVTDGATIAPTTGEISNGVGGTTYTVEYTTGGVCFDVSTQDVTVNPIEDASFTLTDYCFGAANSANITGTTGGTFAFNPAVTDGATIAPTTGEISNGVGGTTYTVEYTTGGACFDVSTQTVTVNPNPVPVITGALQYCQGTSTTLSTTSTYTDYLWSTGSVNQSTSATIADNPITVQVTDALGCVGTSAVANVSENNAFVYNSQIEICQGDSAEIHGNMEKVAGLYSFTYNLPTGCDSTVNVTLVVNPLPNIDAGLDVTICNGESTVLEAMNGTSYTWDNGIGAGNNINVSPTSTTTYIVTGTDANNCSNTDDIIVTVNPLPTATISGTTSVCENGPSPDITITGANGTAPYTFTYNINGGPDITVNSVGNDAIISVPTTPSGTFTYNLVNVEDASATNCAQPQNGSATITINANPLPSTIGDVDYCEGFTASISADQVYTTYDWSTGDDTQTIDVTAANNPITLTVTNTAGCSGTSAAYNIIENPTPIIDAGQDITICEGGATTLTASGAVDYSWDNGLGIGNNFNVSPTSNTIYTVTGTDANGCVGTDDVEVILSAPPTATISGTTSLCENDTPPTVTFTGADGTAPYTFTYNINGGPDLTATSTGNTADVIAPNSPSGVYTFNLISVEESSANNCSQNQSGSAVITVNALPNIEAGTDQVACGNDQITLSATGGVNYVWDNGVQDGVPFSPVTGVYTVIGVDANGCTNTDNVSVLVSPIPVPDFTVDYNSCEPFIATLTNTTPGVSSNCVWQISNTAPIQGCGPLVLTFTSPGQYDVTLTTSNQAGCTASTTVTNAFSFEESPVAEFSPYNTVISTLDTEINFENTSTGASSYNWDFGDNSPNSTDTNPVHEYDQDQTGNYVVTLIAYSNAGCTDTAYGFIRIEEEIIYYVPNTFTPDNDGFNQTFQPVFTAGYDPFDYTLLIFDRWGEIVFESHDVTIGWDGTYSDRFDVQDGTYTWKIEFKTTINDKRISKVGHVNVLR